MILLNFVEQRSIADPQKPSCRLAIPSRLLESTDDCVLFRFAFYALQQRAETRIRTVRTLFLMNTKFVIVVAVLLRGKPARSSAIFVD